jgi:DNA-binding transcriptional MerR regulator
MTTPGLAFKSGDRTVPLQVDFKSRGNVDIAEVAQRSGVSASTLRFYEQRGLDRVGRQARPAGTFDAAVLERLALIALGRAAAFRWPRLPNVFAQRASAHRQEMLAQKARDLDGNDSQADRHAATACVMRRSVLRPVTWNARRSAA